jgi:hypothetical protein
MRRTIVPLLLASLAVPFALSGSAQAGPQEEPAKKEDAREGPKTEEQLAQKEFQEIVDAYDQARREYSTAYGKWRKAKETDPGAKAPTRPDAEFVERFREGAEKYAGSPGAAPFLIRVLGMSRSNADVAKKTLATLLESHIESDQLGQITYTLIYGAYSMGDDTVRDAMTRIIDASPHDDVKSAMYFARGTLVNRDRDNTAEQREGAVADLKLSMEIGPKSQYRGRAESTIYELQNLQVGMAAPEIEGDDLDGVAFKLSDYRGKVVFLDFWGDW